MPYLGAGVDQHVNTAPVPTWVFTPNPVGGASVRLYNEGTQLVYVGGVNVSPYNGLPLWPGSRPVEIQNANGTIYTCSNVNLTTTVMTAASSALAAGASSLSTTAVVASGFAAGTVFVLGAGNAKDVLVVASTAANSTITFTTNTLYDHVGSSLLTAATSIPGQLRVTAGVV